MFSLASYDSLEVSSLSKICSKYDIKPLQNGLGTWFASWIWTNTQKIELINDLCNKLKGTYNVNI